MNLSTLGTAILSAVLLSGSAFGQCSAPELVKDADQYNDLVCKAYAAASDGDNKTALALFLAASDEPLFESPNVLLLGQIARTYAKLHRFREADAYLKYDNLSVLWMIGIVRCQVTPDSKNESLLQDGARLVSHEAKHMTDVLCGPIFDEYSYFRESDAESFIPAANALLRYEAIRKEIELMRHKKSANGQ
jgi:hypothetical protein